jgi:anti-sigma regulatory factor (Ser/Thr protein kinase)
MLAIAPHHHRIELPRRLEAGAVARRFLDTRFGDLISDQAFGRATTVVSELVNNAVIHGKGRITLTAALVGGALRVEVTDQGTGKTPAIREQEPDAVGGWGLRLVEDLTLSWGAFEGSTHVWALIDVE